MRYYRCKCGKCEAWSSMGVADCDGCDECHTTLEEHPDDHTEPAPHVIGWEWKVDGATGDRYVESVCTRCHGKKTRYQHRTPEELAPFLSDSPPPGNMHAPSARAATTEGGTTSHA